MTVSTEINHNEYTGNGETTHFPYTFRIFKNADLVVSVVDLNGNLSVLALDTDYTVTGAGGYSNGNVVLTDPLKSGWQISISRELPVTQETDLRNQGKFFPEIHEDALDKLTMLIQQFWNRIGFFLKKPSFIANYYDAESNAIRNILDPTRPQDAATKIYADTLDAKTNQHIEALNSATLRVPEATISAIPDATTRAGKLLSFDASGAPIASLPPAGSADDVLTELAKSDGATKIGSGTQTVQQVLDTKFDKTGGTVNGSLHVTHSVNVGDVDSGLIANGDGSVAFYAQDLKTGEWNKDRLHWVQNLEVGGKLHTSGGATFGGNITVSWGGRTATFHENGDVEGPIWGGALSGWLHNQLNNRGTKNTAQKAQNGWWKCGDTEVMEQWGWIKLKDYKATINFPREFPIECWNVLIIPKNKNFTVSLGDIRKSSFVVNVPSSLDGEFYYWRAIGC